MIRLRVTTGLPPGSGLRAVLALVLLTSMLFAGAPAASAAPEDYGEYSLMTQRHAGQFYSGGSVAGQWAWTPLGNESDVAWGDPLRWPLASVERFSHSGNWVLLDGFGSPDHGPFYIQRVNRELIGDGSCRNMVPVPSEGGRQHYVQWTIPPGAYCLQAWGTITERLSGTTVNFAHTQVWSPPSSCSNAYLGERTCIRQRESWWDNNGTPGAPITRKLERSVSIARGVGMGFIIDQSYPQPWHAELAKDWVW
ncbi:MAG TPA: hypothetical protein VIY28_16195 [Pseudonocardiaceae bacterium]